MVLLGTGGGGCEIRLKRLPRGSVGVFVTENMDSQTQLLVSEKGPLIPSLLVGSSMLAVVPQRHAAGAIVPASPSSFNLRRRSNIEDMRLTSLALLRAAHNLHNIPRYGRNST